MVNGDVNYKLGELTGTVTELSKDVRALTQEIRSRPCQSNDRISHIEKTIESRSSNWFTIIWGITGGAILITIKIVFEYIKGKFNG